MTDLRIDNLLLLPMDGSDASPLGEVREGSLRLRGDRIAAIGSLEPQSGETVIDCGGLTATPGFVQGHLHFCQTIFRGLADDLSLLDWLHTRIWPLEHAHDPASIRASARLSILELLAGGTTCVQVMETVRHTEASFEVAEQTGITAIIGNCLMDRVGPGIPDDMVTTARQALAMSEELADSFDGQGRLHYAISPRFILSCSEELSREAAALAHDRGLRIHTHACEHTDELTEVRARFGVDYLLALRDQGLLGPRTGLAHCVHTTEAEREVLRASKAAVLHCPSANLKLGSGIAPITEYVKVGLDVALGADGAPCNNRLSALTEMRTAALLQACQVGPGAWPADQALHAATRGGARALGLETELGSLEPGKRADILLWDLASLEPDGAAVSSLVYRATEACLSQVYLGGQKVVENGQVAGMEDALIRNEAREQRDAVLGRAGVSR